MSKELTERLRGAVQQLRRTPMPIADVAPMLNQAADEIERLQRELDEWRFTNKVDEMGREIEHLRLDLATFKHGHRIASERCVELERELAEARKDAEKWRADAYYREGLLKKIDAIKPVFDGLSHPQG